MRINVGCGEFYQPGWVNIDVAADTDRHPDLIGTILDLPVEVTGVTHAYLGHVLEHIPHEQVVPALDGLRERMAPGGLIMTVGPDIHRATRLHAQGQLDAETVKSCGTGGLRWDGDRHWWACHEQLLTEALTDAGWGTVTPVPIGTLKATVWPVTSYALWQCAASAVA